MVGASPPQPPRLPYGTMQHPAKAATSSERERLVWDLARGRCHWTGSALRDWGFHVANHHPLLGCFLCHAAHPYGRPERFAVLLATTALSLPPSAVLGVDLHVERELDGLFLAEVLILVTMPVMIVQGIFDWLAVMDLYLDRRGRSEAPSWCCEELLAWAVWRFKQACFAAAAVLSIAMLLICALVLGGDNAPVHHTAKPFLISRLQCWLLWFVLDLAVPCCGFPSAWLRERAEHDAARADGQATQRMTA